MGVIQKPKDLARFKVQVSFARAQVRGANKTSQTKRWISIEKHHYEVTRLHMAQLRAEELADARGCDIMWSVVGSAWIMVKPYDGELTSDQQGDQ